MSVTICERYSGQQKFAVSTAIHGNHAIACARQSEIPARFFPVLHPTGREPMNEHDDLAIAYRFVSDAHAIG